jgi:hypothetical protein
MTQYRPRVTATTHELPFDKLSPRDFERLCLWLVEREGYERAELIPDLINSSSSPRSLSLR